MPILKLQNLTHIEWTSLSREKTVVFIPVAPLEEHAPHLPLGVDAMLSAYFSNQMAERLEKKMQEWNFVLFPTLFAGSDTLIYAGSFEVHPKTLRALVFDCCKQLAKDGFKNIVLIGAHGGPRHMVVLEEVCTRMRWQYRANIISASSKTLMDVLEGKVTHQIAEKLEKTGDKLSEAEREGLHGDYHAGLLETSLMLHAFPELVKPTYTALEPIVIDKAWKLSRKSAKKTGAGHLGTPHLARKEIGRAASEAFLDTLEPLLIRFLNGEKMNQHFRSKLYYIPIFRTDFYLVLMLLAYAVILGFLFVFLNGIVSEVSR